MKPFPSPPLLVVGWWGAGILAIALWTSTTNAAEPIRWVGSDSCATSTCHGNVEGRGPAWNHAMSTWMANDPHAGAGDVLRSQLSRRIVSRLNPAASQSPDELDRTLRKRCISCHLTATPQDCDDDALLPPDFVAAGVSCEACHGPAGQWLTAHTGRDWVGDSRFSNGLGMRDTESIIGRSDTCVRCHIGSRSEDSMVRDMNHDLIAAGHPALRFDLLIYNQNLPPHWDPQGEPERPFMESPMRVRSVSRAINLATAATLSAQRATAFVADHSVPWPEFADYDCFACHQSLSIEEFKLPPRDRTKSPLHVSDGLPVWNSWHTVRQLELRDSPDLLQKLSPHQSDPPQIAKSGLSLAQKYRQVAKSKLTETAKPYDSIRDVLRLIRTRQPVDWHEAAILYLDLDAAGRQIASQDDSADAGREILLGLEDVERMLRFDPDRSVDQPSVIHSPAAFDPAMFGPTLDKIFTDKLPTNLESP
ncbi:cytochrome c family protein [Rubripirellula lacrimiformis]|uniref:cytochrome c family protein n=1 Tax=Rubripirellula lacrimiformis TaxID=1930273 RepID=UPI001C54D4DF|nr:cytochrome c family protein [Rubripirellula lacrimiformis]